MAEEYLPDVTPATQDAHDGGANYTLGTSTINAGDGNDTGIRVWIPAGVTSPPTLLLYTDAGVLLDSMVATGYTPGAFHSQYFDDPIPRPDGTGRRAAFWTPDGRYGATVPGGWPRVSVGGNLTAGTDNGWIHDGGGEPIFPENEHGSNADFHVSPIFEPAGAPVEVAVGQAVETNTAGAVTPSHRATVGQAIETDTGQAITPSHRVAVSQVVETDTAGSITASGGALRDLDLTLAHPDAKWRTGPVDTRWHTGRVEV